MHGERVRTGFREFLPFFCCPEIAPSYSTAKAAAQETIHQTDVLRLSVADQMAFADALINPQKPNAALRRANKRHAQLISPDGK